ncbi:hypothetical protein [Nisaea sp.]|uniref:hypothetical protein n=1 Tax=Nisaea sp. TaxID=2024842 RepID=UPI00326647FE
MKILSSPEAVRRLIMLDAAVSAASTLLLLMGADMLAESLGLPEQFLHAIGLILVPFVLLVGWTATREVPPQAVVWAIVSANAGWVVASVIVLIGPWLQPTALGNGFVIGQAVVVGLMAEMQFIALWQRQRRGGLVIET